MPNMFDQFDSEVSPAVILKPEVPVRDTSLDVDMSPPDWMPPEEDTSTPASVQAPVKTPIKPAGNMFDQFDEKPKPAAKPGKKAKKSTGNMFDQFDEKPAPAAKPKPIKAPSKPTPAPNFLQFINDQLQPYIPQSARNAAQEAFANPALGGRPVNPVRDINAMIAGSLGLIDAGANFLGQMDPIKQATGFATPEPLRKIMPHPPVWNLQQHWESLPQIQQERAQAPNQFDLIKGMTPAFAPLPVSLPVLKGPGLVRSMVNTAAAQGAISGVMKRGEQLKDPIVRPGGNPQADVAIATAEGALGGAALHGLGAALVNAPKLVKGMAKPVINAFSKQSPEAQKAMAKAAAARLDGPAQFEKVFGTYDKLDPETKAWYNEFYGAPSEEIHGPTKDPMQWHADDVSAELQEPDYPAPKPIRLNADERDLDPYEQAWYDHSKAISHETNMAQMRDQLRYLNEKVEGISEKYGREKQPQDATTGNATPKIETPGRTPVRQPDGPGPQAPGKETLNSGGGQYKPPKASAADVAPDIILKGVKVSAKEYEVIRKAFEPQINKWKTELNKLLKHGSDLPGADDRRLYLTNAISDATEEYTKALNDLVERTKPAPLTKISLNGGTINLESDSSVEGFIDAIKNANTFEESQAAIQAWADQLAGKPVDLENKIVGDFRRPLSPANYGRNKNALALPIDDLGGIATPEMRASAERIAAGKAQLDYDDAVLSSYMDRAFAKFGDPNESSFTFKNGAKIESKEVRARRSREGQAEIDAARAEAPGEMMPVKREVTESMMTSKFGTGSKDYPIEHVRVPDTEEEAGKVFRNLYENKANSEKEYRATKTDEMHEAFSKAEKEIQASTGDPTAGVHVIVKTPHPLGEKYAPVEVAIQYKKGALEKRLTAKAADDIKKLEEIIDARENRTPTKKLFASMKGYKKTKALAMAALFGALQNVKAEAANVGGHVSGVASFLDGWNSIPLNEATLGLFFMHKVAPSLAKLVLEAEEGLLAKAGHIWRDTMDYVHYSDVLINRLNKFRGQSGAKSFETRIMEISGHTQQMSLGVHFDEALKAEGLRTLRSGKVSALDALNQKKGTVFEKMTPEQARALSVWKVGRDEILKLTNERQAFLKQYTWLNENPINSGESVEEYTLRYLREMELEGKTPEILEKQLAAEDLMAYVMAHPHKDLFMPHMAQEAVNFVKENLEGTKAGDTAVERFFAQLMSNWMDGLFFWNPEFHGTNLMDMFISAAPLVGHTNIWAANRMILSNVKIEIAGKQIPIRQVLHDSNLAGGLKVDRAELAAIANSKAKVFTGDQISDIKSDLYNANAVWVGSTLKYHSKNQEILEQNGWTGSGEQFVKDVLAGVEIGGKDFSPTLYMDLYSHNANILSRTLGFDTYRLNTNALTGQWKGGKFLVLFAKQPARVSRLAMHYLANGQMKALYTMMGYTMLVGGRAAIPADLRFLYSKLGSAAGADNANDALDELNAYNKMTGETLTPKVEMYTLWPLAAGSSPQSNAKEAIAKTAGIVQKQIESGEFDPGAIVKSPASSLLPAVAPRLGIPGTRYQLPIPTGEALRISKAANQSLAGEKNLYAQKAGMFSPADTETQDLSDPYDSARNFVGSTVMPGVSSQQDQHQAVVESRDAMEHDGYNLGNLLFGKPDRPSNYESTYQVDRSIIKQLFKQLTGS